MFSTRPQVPINREVCPNCVSLGKLCAFIMQQIVGERVSEGFGQRISALFRLYSDVFNCANFRDFGPSIPTILDIHLLIEKKRLAPIFPLFIKFR